LYLSSSPYCLCNIAEDTATIETGNPTHHDHVHLPTMVSCYLPQPINIKNLRVRKIPLYITKYNQIYNIIPSHNIQQNAAMKK